MFFYKEEGYIYKGYFSQNLKNGYGEFKYQKKQIYKGYWKDNKKHGKAVVTYPDDTEFRGYFFYNQKNGRCFFIDAGNNVTLENY